MLFSPRDFENAVSVPVMLLIVRRVYEFPLSKQSLIEYCCSLHDMITKRNQRITKRKSNCRGKLWAELQLSQWRVENWMSTAKSSAVHERITLSLRPTPSNETAKKQQQKQQQQLKISPSFKFKLFERFRITCTVMQRSLPHISVNLLDIWGPFIQSRPQHMYYICTARISRDVPFTNTLWDSIELFYGSRQPVPRSIVTLTVPSSVWISSVRKLEQCFFSACELL